MKNNKGRNPLKSFVGRWKNTNKNKKQHIISGLLVAGVVCVALLVTGYAVFSDVSLANAEETPYYPTLDGNYANIGSFNIVVQDGIGPFDTNTDPNAADYCNRPGNDSSDSNGIIRSYDTIFYQLNYTTVLKDTEKSIVEGFIWYESTLNCTKEQAIFNFTNASTSWVGDEYDSVSELEQSNKGGYVLTEEDGKQHLVGKVLLLPETGNPAAIPGEGSLYIAVSVMKMYQGDIVEPSFSVWLDHNEESEKKHITPDEVKVTSQLRMNVQLARVADGHLGTMIGRFDFSTGNEFALDKDAGDVYGAIKVYGITLQLKNDNNADGRNLKGCELPAGDITFDLNLGNVKYKKVDGTEIALNEDKFKPLIWSFDINLASSITKNSDGTITEKNPQRDGRTVYKYASLAGGAAPQALRDGSTAIPDFNKSNQYTCSGGGTWDADRIDNNTIRVTVSNYYPKLKNGEYLTYFTSFPNNNIYDDSNNRYYNPVDYDYNNPIGSISVGCFTAGEMYVVVPLSDEKGTLLSQYGEGTLSWEVTDSETISVGSQNPNDSGVKERIQTDLQDDYVAMSYEPKEGGRYSSNILYSSDHSSTYDVQGTSQWSYNGLDVAPIGQAKLGIAWRFSEFSLGTEGVVYAANSLLKFDDEAIDFRADRGPSPSDSYNVRSDTAVYTYLYAAKVNGTGWNNDAEMNNAKTEDLVYYESLDALKNDGKVCVGVLLEFRDVEPSLPYSISIGSYLPIKLKDDYSLVGNTYQIVVDTTIWSAEILNIKPETDSVEEIKGKLPPTLVTQKDLGDSKVVLPNGLYLNRIQNENGEYVSKQYNKTVYIDDVPQEGYSASPALGDSLHIIGYKATVKKAVTNTDKNGNVKTTFNLNNKERTVNYKISPSIKYGVDGLDYNQKTTVTVVDKIPQALIYNNDYVVSDDNDNYEKIKLSVTSDQDNNTILTWVFNGVTVGKEMPQITYSCNISENPKLVSVGDTFTNTAEVHVKGGMPIDVRNENIATAAIKVTGLSQISFSKFADKPVYDARVANDPLSWTMYMGNNSSSTYVDDVWLDVLPYDGDENGSDFAFPLKVTNLTLYGSGAPNTFGTWEAYYTTDVKVRGTNASAYDADEIRAGESGGVKWYKLTLTFNGTTGTVSGLPQDGDLPTALVVIGNLDKKEIFKANVAVDNSLSTPGEILVNRFSRLDANVSDTVRIVSRSISGLVWWDANFDGLQDENEQTITTGVKVTLMQLNKDGEYEPFIYNGKALTVPVGTRISGLTGQTEPITAGSYDFIELPAGTYAVRFEADNNEEFKRWSASPKNVAENSNDEKDSDATPTYDRNERLLRTDITGIALPSIELSTDGTTYITTIKREHNDSGLYAYTQNLNINKVDSAVREAIEGVEFTLYRVDVDTNGKWNPIDSTATIVASNADGMVNFNALEPGYYVLKETKAADGYHLPDTTWKLAVGHSGIPTLKDDKDNVVELNSDNNYVITNNVTTIIPLTGGIGTDIFYVAGVLLVMSSAIMLMYQRKRRAYR